MNDIFLDVLREGAGAVFLHHEDVPVNFDGTVIDIETVGPDLSLGWDLVKQHKQVILGVLGVGELNVFYVSDSAGIAALGSVTELVLSGCERPYYAFNCGFERTVWRQLRLDVMFDGELQKAKEGWQSYNESKKGAVKTLGIVNYDDPFFDNGKLCADAWRDGNVKLAVQHNRACLLKERDILLKRGSRKPEYD